VRVRWVNSFRYRPVPAPIPHVVPRSMPTWAADTEMMIVPTNRPTIPKARTAPSNERNISNVFSFRRPLSTSGRAMLSEVEMMPVP
jgi:hypothetical protein